MMIDYMKILSEVNHLRARLGLANEPIHPDQACGWGVVSGFQVYVVWRVSFKGIAEFPELP